MNKHDLYIAINKFAPYDTAESWDCSGWIVDNGSNDIKRIMLCLTVTESVFEQAMKNNCDLILSHHPLFYVPIKFKDINILCAHTNLDKAKGGTTDMLIQNLGLPQGNVVGDFLRVCEHETTLHDFGKKLCELSENVRVVNNKQIDKLNKIAFCAGSGSDFLQEAQDAGADALVTGDLKFHTALESEIVIFDIGHFESEIPVLKVFENIISENAEIYFAEEKSPFLQIKS